MGSDLPPDFQPIDRYGAVSDPTELPGKFTSLPGKAVEAVNRNIVPMMGMSAADILGTAVATALAPETGGLSYLPMIAGPAAAGFANMEANRYLPPSLGGEPERGKLSSFAWGALPSFGMGRLANIAERRALGKAGERTYGAMTEGLGTLAEPSEAERLERVQGVLNRPIKRPDILTGKEQTKSTFSLRDLIRKPVQREKTELGQPIGEAYDTLKGVKTPAPVEDFDQVVREILRNRRAPISLGAQQLLQKAKSFAKRLKPEKGIEDQLIEMPGGEFKAQGTKPPTVQDLRLQGFNDNQIAKLLAKIKEKPKPPTLDELREFRQQVNIASRRAVGGNRYVLGQLEKAIDKKLEPFLPGIKPLRGDYAGLVQRFTDADLNAVKRMKTVRQLGEWVFGKQKPELTHEVIRLASPVERQELGEAFKDVIMRKVNPDKTSGEMMAEIHKAMEEYIANGTTRELFGENAERELAMLLHSPAHAQEFMKMIQRPTQQAAWSEGWTDAFTHGPIGEREAAQRAFEAVYQSLPDAEKRVLDKMGQRGVNLPVFPTTQEAIESGLKTPGKELVPTSYLKHRLGFQGPMIAGRALMGSPGYAASMGLAFAGIAASKAGWKAIIENGGGGALAKLYATSGGREAAQAAFKMLAAMEARGLQEATYKPEEGAQP